MEEAKTVLKQIDVLLKKEQTLANKGINADLEALLDVRNQIQDLSSRYYEIVPQARYKNQLAPPIQSYSINGEMDKLSKLGDIEIASRILLGALYKQSEMHPVDYIHKAMNINMQYLPSGDE